MIERRRLSLLPSPRGAMASSEFARPPGPLDGGDSYAENGTTMVENDENEFEGRTSLRQDVLGPPLEVKLRVFDEGLQKEKEFYCETKLLLAHMSYFRKYLTESDDTDILIHCDIYVFSWLMKYVKSKEVEDLPVFNDENCLPVLIASNFLEMRTLVGECVSYIADHFKKLLHMPTDLNFLTQELVNQLADEMDVVTLEEVWQEIESSGRHPKSKANDEVKSLGAKNLLDKLYERKLAKIIATSGDVFAWCATCCKIYCKTFEKDLLCPKAKVKISLEGEVKARHDPSPKWEVKKYLSNLKEVCHHRHLYWFFWSKLTRLECLACKEAFMASDMKKCTFHPKKALYPPTELCGYYLCCKRDASKFNSLHGVTPNTGCKECDHDPDLSKLTDRGKKEIALFKAHLTQSMPMYAELDNFNFRAVDAEGSEAASCSGEERGSASWSSEALLDSNLTSYFNFMRNQSHVSRSSSDVKLRLFGQNYQEASNGDGGERFQKGRRSILQDALLSMDAHRMQDLLDTLTRQRISKG